MLSKRSTFSILAPGSILGEYFKRTFCLMSSYSSTTLSRRKGGHVFLVLSNISQHILSNNQTLLLLSVSMAHLMLKSQNKILDHDQKYGHDIRNHKTWSSAIVQVILLAPLPSWFLTVSDFCPPGGEIVNSRYFHQHLFLKRLPKHLTKSISAPAPTLQPSALSSSIDFSP